VIVIYRAFIPFALITTAAIPNDGASGITFSSIAAYAYTILDSIDEMQGMEQYIQGHYLVGFDRICHTQLYNPLLLIYCREFRDCSSHQINIMDDMP